MLKKYAAYFCIWRCFKVNANSFQSNSLVTWQITLGIVIKKEKVSTSNYGSLVLTMTDYSSAVLQLKEKNKAQHWGEQSCSNDADAHKGHPSVQSRLLHQDLFILAKWKVYHQSQRNESISLHFYTSIHILTWVEQVYTFATSAGQVEPSATWISWHLPLNHQTGPSTSRP